MSNQRDLERMLRKAGCAVDKSRRHLRITHPDVEKYAVVPSSMGKGRSFQNSLALLRRMGFPI